ncbi:unnamed protein product [Meganyctiphanes norvegica]|uniref:Uncharacterized protein n=1 Tax=Meganyctiphanes norvegica TaxID=48144 RepID=A0AAV2R5S3_MEGNR
MSESIQKGECAANFDQSACFYNIENENKDIEMMHSIENSKKTDESYYPQEALPKSAYGMSEVRVNNENKISEEPLKIHSVEIKLKEEIEIYTEPIAGEKPNQDIQCDKDVSHNCDLINHPMVHNGEKLYQNRQCNKTVSYNSDIIIYPMKHIGEKTSKSAKLTKPLQTKVIL